MFAVNWKEDSSCEVLARLTARNATGEYTGVRGEGRWIQQADVTSITAKVYDLTDDPDMEAPEELVLDKTIVILDVPDESGEVWKDDIGYNFRHHMTPNLFPSPNVYRVEYRIELLGGYVVHESFEGPAGEVHAT